MWCQRPYNKGDNIKINRKIGWNFTGGFGRSSVCLFVCFDALPVTNSDSIELLFILEIMFKQGVDAQTKYFDQQMQ